MHTATAAQEERQRMPSLDAEYYMAGDEDGGVALQCKVCDREGLPVAYLTTRGDRSWQGTDVIVAYSIDELLRSASMHTHSE